LCFFLLFIHLHIRFDRFSPPDPHSRSNRSSGYN
jgi:hypothetical protein